MNGRLSVVGTLNINTVSNTTVLEIGDSEDIAPINYTLAVQREKAIFWENEFDFSDYTIFSRAFPQPVANEPITITRIQECPQINVHHIRVFILLFSAVTHIGSSERLNSETRIKHVRHLLRESPDQSSPALR